jgi:hypothetical protein
MSRRQEAQCSYLKPGAALDSAAESPSSDLLLDVQEAADSYTASRLDASLVLTSTDRTVSALVS